MDPKILIVSFLPLPPTTRVLWTLQAKFTLLLSWSTVGTFLNRVQTHRISLKQVTPWMPWEARWLPGWINIARTTWLWSRKKMYVLKKKLAQSLGNPIIRSILILTVSKDPTPTSVWPGEGSEKYTPSFVFGWNARAILDFLPRRQIGGKPLPLSQQDGGIVGGHILAYFCIKHNVILSDGISLMIFLIHFAWGQTHWRYTL